MVNCNCERDPSLCVQRLRLSVELTELGKRRHLKMHARCMCLCVSRRSCVWNIYYSLLICSFDFFHSAYMRYVCCCISWLHRRVRTEPNSVYELRSVPRFCAVIVGFLLSFSCRIRFWLRHILNFNSVSNLLCCESRAKAIFQPSDRDRSSYIMLGPNKHISFKTSEPR